MVIFVLSYEACEQPANSEHNAITPRDASAGTSSFHRPFPSRDTKLRLSAASRKPCVVTLAALPEQRLAEPSVHARQCSVIRC